MLLLLSLLLALLAAIPPAAFVGIGWLKFHRLEQPITQKMDQYYLAITSGQPEEYLLSGDEVFEVPYMASRLSVQAEPSRVYDRHGALIGEWVAEKGLYVRSPDDLPAFLKKALVASEDGGFYRHRGVDHLAMTRAMVLNLVSMRRRPGGSTLTQQLAKMLFTTRERTWARKTFEMFCARRLERKFTKDQILLMYLDFAYFGHGCHGIESAARFYFNKPAASLELAESAMLVGIIPNPNRYSPFHDVELAKARHRTVLRRMAKLGYIPASSVERYSSEFWKAMEPRLVKPEVSFWRMSRNEAPYFIEHVRRRLAEVYPKERVIKGGLKVFTTADVSVQKAAQEALEEGVREESRRALEEAAKAAEKAGKALEKPKARVEGALAAVSPVDGGILALVGGSGFDFGNQLERATTGRRPIGSSVKPFIFGVAFESGFTPEDVMEDAPASYRMSAGRSWTPRNYESKYHGAVTLRVALQKSLNTVAVKLLSKVDMDRVIALLSKASGAEPAVFGKNLSLALGTCGLTPLELAASYSVFVNGGRPVQPYAIARVEDREGGVLCAYSPETSTATVKPCGPGSAPMPSEEDEEEDRATAKGTEKRTPQETKDAGLPADAGEPVLSTAAARALVDVMQGVFKPGGTAYEAARRIGFHVPAAGKTGTTDDYRDAWCAGVTPDLSAAVRVGHDDMRIPLGRGRSGGAVAAPIWTRFVKEVYRSRPTREFK